MDGHQDLFMYSAERLIELCRATLRWRDLSNEVIMDVGCGEEGFCGLALLEKFPDVKTIIGIDNDRNVIRNFRPKNKAKMKCVYADIEKRETLQDYEGKIDKVISTYVFHHFTENVDAFRNVYYLLKPGREAAIKFLRKSLQYEWLTKMLKKKEWKNAFKCQYIEDAYKSEFGADHYKEIVENMGFRVVDCGEEERVTPYLSDDICKDSLYKMSEDFFKIHPGVLEEFKNDCLQVLLKLNARDDQGNPCYKVTELTLFLRKPRKASTSQRKE